MTKIAVIYHSGYGHTRSLALAVEAGAKEIDGAEVILLTAEEAIQRLDMLDHYDAMIFGCPTYMGGAHRQSSKSSWRRRPRNGFLWHGKTSLLPALAIQAVLAVINFAPL